jgi:pyruvate,water dikinase
MKMVRADLASAGVMFSLDTESGFRDVVFITGAYGLGENVVQGAVGPDEFYVHKPTFVEGHRSVLRRRLGEKKIRMVYALGGGREMTRNVPTFDEDRERFCLTDAEVLTLADYAIAVERHYSRQAGHAMPMDMEWGKDGLDGKLYLLQARPETVVSQRGLDVLEQFELTGKGPVLVSGRAVGEKAAAGAARVIRSVIELRDFQANEVLVADTTTPDWEPVMKRAAAIVTSRGGRTCHAAIVARELGIPAVVGASGATERIGSGQVVTVSCAEVRQAGSTTGGFRSDPQGQCHGDPAPGDVGHGESRQSRPGVSNQRDSQRRRRACPSRVHHQRGDQSPPDGPLASRANRGSQGAGGARRTREAL